MGLLTIAGTLGVISPSGNEVGPFWSIEQAALSQVIPSRWLCSSGQREQSSIQRMRSAGMALPDELIRKNNFPEEVDDDAERRGRLGNHAHDLTRPVAIRGANDW
jgi:hypothetical protein